MPFGLKNAPKSFQRTMEHILHGIENVSVFVDDILIASKDQLQHKMKVKEVIGRLYEHGCKINYEKSSFNKKKLNFWDV